MSFRSILASVTLTGFVFAASAADHPYLHAPAVEEYAKHDPHGTTILPDGRFLKPVGRHLAVASFPYGLAMSPDGKVVFVASDGAGHLITGWQEPNPTIAVIEPPKFARKKGRKERPTNAGGADFSPDGRLLYWSSGERDRKSVV